MKTKLSFIGMQATPESPERGFALFNDAGGNTLGIFEAIKRHGHDLESDACVLVIWLNDGKHEIPFYVTDSRNSVPTGWGVDPVPRKSWVFSRERRDAMLMVEEIIAKVDFTIAQCVGLPKNAQPFWQMAKFAEVVPVFEMVARINAGLSKVDSAYAVLHRVSADAFLTSELCHGMNHPKCPFDECPQHRDNEPESSGRGCPLDHEAETDD